MRRRIAMAGRAALAVALVSACGLASSVARAPAAAKAGKGRPAAVVVSPHRAGRPAVLKQRFPARPLWIRVRAGERKQLNVSLNGRTIHRHFSAPSNRGVRKLRVSPSHGLRHGVNVLRVRVRGGGPRARRHALRFRVKGNRPLAAAGVNRVAAAGARVHLDGSESRLHPRAARRRGRPGLHHRWKIVRAPRGSRLARDGRVALRAGPAVGVSPSGSLTPSFKPDTPGTYTAKLTVTASDGTQGQDRVQVRADPPPAVPIDTMGNCAEFSVVSGIQVGAACYPSQTHVSPTSHAQEGALAQLVALDRKTLTPVSGPLADLANKSYFDGTPGDHLAALEADLNRLTSNQLVIVSNPMSDSRADGTRPYCRGFEGHLGRIGVENDAVLCSPNDALPGAISAIGVPGTSPGEGDWHVGATRQYEGAGSMRDYLVRDNEGNYEFAPSERPEFNTQAAGSDGSTNVIEIAGQRFSQDLAQVPKGGFHVVVIDRRTLGGTSYSFDTATDRGVIPATQVLQDMGNTLKQANDSGDKLVFVASRGTPFVQGGGTYDPLNQSMTDLANAIERLGGTRNGIFRALDPGLSKDSSYTLVGSSKAGAGQGEETLAGNTVNPAQGKALNTAPLTGTLARTGPNYAFEVQTTRPAGADAEGDPSRAVTELTKLAFQLPASPAPVTQSQWPEEGNAGRSAAIAWVGQEVLGTSDPRTQYWTQPYSLAYWQNVSGQIAKLTRPQDATFTQADLAWAQAELEQEIGWLISTHDYLAALSAPFSKSQLQSWADLQQISNSIRDKVGVSPDQKTISEGKASFDFAREFLSALSGELSEAAYAANDIYDLVITLVEINNEPAEDEFQSRADEVGQQLAERLTAAQEMLTRQLPNIIAADYQKLKTVGACASPIASDWRANCPLDHTDWQFTQDDQANAAQALRPSLEGWAYSVLLPARYSLYQLPQWWRTKTDNDFYGITFDAAFYPFDGLPDSAQVAKPIYRKIPDYSHTINSNYQSSGDTWQIFALGYLTGSGTILDRWVMHHPEASVTDRLFKPASAGGLGVDAETFFDRYFKPVTLDHYPEKDTPTGWCASPIRVADPCD